MRTQENSTTATAIQIAMAISSFDDKECTESLINNILIHCLLDPEGSFGPKGRAEVYAFLSDLKSIHNRAHYLRSQIEARDIKETEAALNP